MRKFFFLFSAVVLLLLSSGNIAFAHATPITYEPAASTVLEKIPDRVRIHFSERIEPKASGISVRSPKGEGVDIGDPSVDVSDSHLYQVRIKDAGPGTYTVSWQVVSADDGHFTKGAFAFSIGKETVNPLAGASGQIQIQHITSIPQAASMWMELLGQSLLLGILALFAFAWKPLKKRFRGTISSQESRTFEKRASIAASVSLLLILGGAASLLILKTLDLEQLRGAGFWGTFSIFITTLEGTHAILRGIFATLAVAFFFVRRRSIFDNERCSRKEPFLFFLVFLMALSRARVSHSAAADFFPSLSVLLTALHLFAKELWIGGLVTATFLVLPVLGKTKSSLFPKAFFLTSFSRIASIALGVVGVTGAYIVWLDLKDPAYLFTSEWGARCIILALFGGALFALRLYHQLFVERSMVGQNKQTNRMVAWLNYTFPLEGAIGVALLFVTSILIITTPPYPSTRFLFEKHATSQGAVITLRVHPYEPEQFLLTITDEKQGALEVNNVVVKLTNEEKSIGPLVAETQERFPGGYVFPRNTLTLPGTWRVDVLALRQQAFDASASFMLNYPGDIDQARVATEHRLFGLFELLMLIIALAIAALSIILYRLGTGLNNALSALTSKNFGAASPLASSAKSTSFALAGLLLISAFIWLSYDQFIRTDFQKRCEQDGNFWLQSVPMQGGVASSSDTITGCTLNLGLYHFVDEREYAYFLRPRQSGATIATVPEKPLAGEPTQIIAQIYTIERGKKTGPVEDIAIYHDRILHVLIVGEDLKTFAHIHTEDLAMVTQEMKAAGTFPLRYVFPKAGHYTIVVNYVVGGRELSQQSFVEVAGAPRMEASTLDEDRSLQKDINGYHVTLETAPHIKAGELTKITYIIEKDGKPVTNLEPYLGAAMHLALVRADLGRVIHTHGQVYLPGSAFFQQLFQDYVNYHSHFVPDRFGPKIQARVTFPQPARYQIFGEFKHEGRTVVTSFALNVE